MRSPESARPAPIAEKDPLASVKEAAIRDLLSSYDSVIAEAEQKKSLTLLEKAERILNKAEKVKTAKTAEEVNELMKEAPAFSPEHLKVLDSIFGEGNLDEAEIPDPEEFTPAYFDKMYPKEKRPEDAKRGLVSFRPDWLDQNADASVVGPKPETWGEAFIRSMKMEAKELSENSAQIFSESIQKPKFRGGKQQYGSEKGEDPTLDPLLPLIKKIFGKDANRFNHSHDELMERLIPEVEEKIREQFKAKGLSIPRFRVILEPALVFNRQTTEKHPKNSRTNTWERSSTILRTQDSRDSGRRLDVGYSDDGGAGDVNSAPRGAHVGYGGFRLAVVLEK